MERDLKEYVAALLSADVPLILTQAGKVLSGRFGDELQLGIAKRRTVPPYFRQDDFESSQDVIHLIQDLHANNGDVLYYSGEIARKTGDPDKGHGPFFRYLEKEKKLLPTSRQGGIEAEACRTPDGFCRQRTAWIDHLLANDIFDAAHDTRHLAPHKKATFAVPSITPAKRSHCIRAGSVIQGN